MKKIIYGTINTSIRSNFSWNALLTVVFLVKTQKSRLVTRAHEFDANCLELRRFWTNVAGQNLEPEFRELKG